MIRVRYIPQVGLLGHALRYSWAGRVLTATLYRGDEVVGQEVYDLSAFQPGDEVVGVEPEALPFSPLVSVHRGRDAGGGLALLVRRRRGAPTRRGGAGWLG
jgi:hypothetical protein